MTKNKQPELTEKEKSILSEFLGKKLAFFVNELSLSDPAKELLLRSLPNLSDQEIEKLILVLEEKYLSESDELRDLEFENDLYDLLIKHNKVEEKIDQDTISEMDKIFNKEK